MSSGPRQILSLAERFPRARPAMQQRPAAAAEAAAAAASADVSGGSAQAAAATVPFRPFDYGSAPADTSGTRAALLAEVVAAEAAGSRGASSSQRGRGAPGGGKGFRGKHNPYMLGTAAASILESGGAAGRGVHK